MIRFAWICFAGALGTGSRYLVSVWAGQTFSTAFPYGTLIVNVAGCFLIAAIMRTALTTALIPDTLRLTLTTGFMGGLTTYSSFCYETTKLAQDRALGLAALNFVATTVMGFGAALLGFAAASWAFGR